MGEREASQRYHGPVTSKSQTDVAQSQIPHDRSNPCLDTRDSHTCGDARQYGSHSAADRCSRLPSMATIKGASEAPFYFAVQTSAVLGLGNTTTC